VALTSDKVKFTFADLNVVRMRAVDQPRRAITRALAQFDAWRRCTFCTTAAANRWCCLSLTGDRHRALRKQ
jgi:hypothetical protein